MTDEYQSVYTREPDYPCLKWWFFHSSYEINADYHEEYNGCSCCNLCSGCLEIKCKKYLCSEVYTVECCCITVTFL